MAVGRRQRSYASAQGATSRSGHRDYYQHPPTPSSSVSSIPQIQDPSERGLTAGTTPPPNKASPQLASYESKVSRLLRAESFPQNRQKSSRNSNSNRNRDGRDAEDDDDDYDDGDDDDNDEPGRKYGCYFCFQMLPAARFVEPKHLPANVPVNLRRFCILCGIDEGVFHPGNQITPMEGSKAWVCDCRVLRSEYEYRCDACPRHAPFSSRS